MNITLTLVLLLCLKHFVVDYPLQRRYQYSNKGTYGHPGGILHAALHGIGTYACLYWWAPQAAVYLGFVDMVLHYHIDWAKVYINTRFGWGPTTHEEFWILLGFDQLLHMLTYVFIINLVTV
jgi:hypothetical protein